jgi:uncharacterized protein with GYD domain
VNIFNSFKKHKREIAKIEISTVLLRIAAQGEDELPLYVMLTKLTSDGRKSVMENPGRILEVNKELEEMGAKIIAQYALLGNYDFVNIFQAQSNEVIARVSAKFGSRGTLEPMTLAAISMEEYVRELETAKIISR